MAQYDIVEAIFRADRPLTEQELISKIDLHSGSVKAGIKQCVSKKYIEKTSEGYVTVSGFDEESLENIRPKTIDELRGNK